MKKQNPWGIDITHIKDWKRIEKTLEKQRIDANAWDIKPLLVHDCKYYMLIGERSDGKTYDVLLYSLIRFFEDGSELAIVRRYREDFRGKRAHTLFKPLIENDVVKMLSGGEWDGVLYYQSSWWFTKRVERKSDSDEKSYDIIRSESPFAYAFSLSEWEHDKSSAYPFVNIMLFDECITTGYYLPNEFLIFQNVISTIKRKRTNFKIFMCGNTINKFCPYFAEMGLTNIKKQEKGTIDIYSYGSTNLRVAVAFTDAPARDKESDEYFAFNNPSLNMITGAGDGWQIDVYPHLPVKYKPKEIIYQYFIKFDGEILHAEIINGYDEEHKCEVLFTYIHRKTTEIKDGNQFIVYQPEFDVRENYRRRITKPVLKVEQKIVSFFARNKVFYQDNEVGSIVDNYMKWSQSASALN